MATPLLSLLGYPGFVAVAFPLPATVPSTLVASREYWRSRLLDWEIVWWSIAIGTSAIVAGSLLSPFAGAKPLLVVTELLVLVFGVSFLFFPKARSLTRETADNPEVLRPAYWRARLVVVAIGVGHISGLLANAGGFLLVPCNHALSRFRASRPPVGYQSRPLRDNDYELCIGRLLVYALCVCWYMFSMRIQC